MRTLVWFRGKDLRLADHGPLRAAVRGGEAIPLFVLDPFFFAPERAREIPHRMQFLLDSLRELGRAIAERGSRLVVVEGRSVEIVPRLAREWRVDRVVAHRWTEPFGRERDRRVGDALSVPFELHEGETLVPPGSVRNGSGGAYVVFTPFARAFVREVTVPAPIPTPKRLPPLPADVRTPSRPIPTCEDLGFRRNEAILPGGEAAGRERLRRFLAGPARAYDQLRDRLDREGTSRLSADLKFGTISVRGVWRAIDATLGGSRAARSFQNELLWREFAHGVLWENPSLLREPFRPAFEGFPWRADAVRWKAWAEGTTGYPVVDAAARQLLAEGFVPNRARMVAASFLAKHLLVDFRRGEAHYLRWLTDGDWAQNDLGWQWSAGSGCDAQPWFRIFDPVAQGRRFDPDGTWVRRWVPELGGLPARWIHRPWAAPPAVLAEARVVLGQTYPAPIVEHAAARAEFLAVARAHLSRMQE